MSVSLLLIPAALAVAGIVGGIGAAGVQSQSGAENTRAAKPGKGAPARPATADEHATPVQVQTRMKNADLLASALHDLGATSVGTVDGELTAVVDDLSLRMTRDADGIWTAHVAGADGRDADVGDATALMTRIDTAYARRVQQEVAARIRTRADDAGFELVSESRQEDDSVTMVLSVRDGRS
ncbi:hypothetical protein [Microbacterium sp. H1-D42]|uniref:hypothetical protein n=1 Tax=Microbacterium sp. H1-D42 TaxID=2925844 RepID=UPI001F53DC3E|nr:hypothetical protein [Microbacterium sp. H1-D42]UNK72233.1 hypothetical protein MNR00_07265 [Microbacterium sp. H1-D42]